jgi:predicted RNA-binding Zn ribbon-like protein
MRASGGHQRSGASIDAAMAVAGGATATDRGSAGEIRLRGRFFNVKACEGPACTLMFADHTRGRARRWCSMAICGNRAKQAAHRQRLKMQQ